MRKHISKLLNLPELWVDSWEIAKTEIRVKVRSPRTTAHCPDCGKRSKKIHQYHTRRLKHSIWQSRLVILVITRRRFFCRTCQRPFSERLPGIDRRRNTGNFRSILLKDMSHQNFHQTLINGQTSSSVLYSVLADQGRCQSTINWQAQRNRFTLGIDEHSFRGHDLVLTLTNITEKKLLMVGVNDQMQTLRHYLETAPKHQISEVCMDMRAGYLHTVSDVLPQARITVDKFHVIAAANQMLDEVRSIIVAKHRRTRRILLKGKEKLSEKESLKLQTLFREYEIFPSLRQAYFIKEQVRELYRLKNKAAAKKMFSDLLMFCETTNSRFIQDYGKTLKRWQEYILNYFDHYSTNAFTEGVHTKIKMLKRLSFGFRNVHHYIAKMMLAFVPLLFLNHHTV